MLSPIALDTSPVDYYYHSTCDIETGRNGRLLAASLYYNGSEYEVYNDWGDWLSRVIALSKKNKKLRLVWAHNGANYDWQHLAEYIKKERPDISVKILLAGNTGVSMQLSITGIKYKIRLVDSYRLLPQSLASLSKDMGIETPKLDIEGVHPEELYNTNSNLFYEYLRHDTIAVSEILYKFQHIINENVCLHNPARELKTTIASMAMYVLRLEFLKKNIFVPWNGKIKAAERASYHGGLVSAPKHGIYEDCSGVDINSSYPYVMANMALPDSHQITWTKKYRPGELGMYHVRYETYDNEFPHIFNENGVVSTHGETWVTSIELDDIMKYGKADIIEGFTYDTSSYWLKEYSESLFELKAKSKQMGNMAIYTVAKLLNNGLSGKFGQSEIVYTLVSADTPGLLERIEKADNNRRRGRAFEDIRPMGRFYRIGSPSISNYTFVAVISFITAKARIRLMEAVRANREHALYTDTDSLIVQGDVKGIEIGKKLGQWSMEFSGCEFTLLGRKSYAIVGNNGIEKVRMKGVTLPKISDKIEKQNYLLDVVNRLKLCVSDIDHSETFSYSSPPTNHDVLVMGKKSGLWIEKHRAVRVTSDYAKQARIMQPYFELPPEKNTLDEMCTVIRSELGGIAPYSGGYMAAEYAGLPLFLKNRRGPKPDQVAEYLSNHYPYFGVATETELYDALTRKAFLDHERKSPVSRHRRIIDMGAILDAG